MANPELVRGRRTKGGSRGIRRIKEQTRRMGGVFESPPLPPALTPEQRAEWDTFILPKIKGLPTYTDITPYMTAVEDFWIRRKGLHDLGKTAKDPEAFEAALLFDKDHPELERDNAYGILKPAFEIITGRFQQVENVMNARRR